MTIVICTLVRCGDFGTQTIRSHAVSEKFNGRSSDPFSLFVFHCLFFNFYVMLELSLNAPHEMWWNLPDEDHKVSQLPCLH